MDIDTIEPGEDFVTVIENAVGSCEILIVVIGRQWLTSTGRNTGRLDNPNDFVRLEIATALSRDIRVIPVLVQRASMPKPQDLPDDLAKFAHRNAVELSDNDWQNDVVQLIGVVERVLEQRKSRHLYVALVVFMLVALLGGLYALSHIGRSKEVPKSDAGQNPTDDSSPASTSTTPSIENRNMNNADKPGQNSSSSSNGNTGNANKRNFNVRPSIPVQPNTGEAERQRQAIKKLDEAARQKRAIDALNDEKPVKKPTPR